MLQIIFENIKIIGMLFGLFGLFFCSNTMFGLYLNTNIKKENFEWDRLLSGLKRGIILFIGIISLVLGVSTIGSVINMAEIIDIDPSIIDGISIVAIATIILYSTIDYAQQSISKFKEIMNKEED